MAPAIIPTHALPPVQHVVVAARPELQPESAAATVALLEMTEQVLSNLHDSEMDSLRADVARQRVNFERTMREILQEREHIIQQRPTSSAANNRHPARDATTTSWSEHLLTSAKSLFATDPTASAIWHTPEEEQTVSDTLRLIDQAAPTRQVTDPTYHEAVTFLRNLYASYSDTPQGLRLRVQLRAITNREAREKLDRIINGYAASPRLQRANHQE
jgi:hypothetical protein